MLLALGLALAGWLDAWLHQGPGLASAHSECHETPRTNRLPAGLA